MSYKVLVVDDEQEARDLFNDLLSREDCLVSTSASAEEAIELVSKGDFDAVLMDIYLPGMDGLEALKKIKELKKDIEVIMITALGYGKDLITKAKEYGCSGYIGKNMPVSQIISSFKFFMVNAKAKKKDS